MVEQCQTMGIKINRKRQCFIVGILDTERSFSFKWQDVESPHEPLEAAKKEHASLQQCRDEAKKYSGAQPGSMLKDHNVKGRTQLLAHEKREHLAEILWKQKPKVSTAKNHGASTKNHSITQECEQAGKTKSTLQEQVAETPATKKQCTPKQVSAAPTDGIHAECSPMEAPANKNQRTSEPTEAPAKKKQKTVGTAGAGESNSKKEQTMLNLPGTGLTPGKGMWEDVTANVFRSSCVGKTVEASADFTELPFSEEKASVIVPKIGVIKFAEMAVHMPDDRKHWLRGFLTGAKVSHKSVNKGCWFMQSLFVNDPAVGDQINQREFRSWMDANDNLKVLGRREYIDQNQSLDIYFTYIYMICEYIYIYVYIMYIYCVLYIYIYIFPYIVCFILSTPLFRHTHTF